MQSIDVNDESESKDRKQRKTFSKEEKLERLKEYEQYSSNYPKGQLCNFFLRGLCWMEEKCQFAHGIDDLNFDQFLKFSQGRKEKILNNSDYVKAVQRTYLIHNRSYKGLFLFQENNKHLVAHCHTYEQLNSDPRKKIELRRIFHFYEFEKFCDLIFKKFPILTIEDFETMIENLGFDYNYRYFGAKKLLSKSISEKSSDIGKNKNVKNVKQVKRSIITLMPSEDVIVKNFITILVEKLKDDLNSGLEIFPISFKYVNNTINKNSNFETPLIHHYLKMKNKTANEFMEDLIENENFKVMLKEILNLKGKEFPPPEEIIHKQNLNEIIVEIGETFWEKFKNSEEEKNTLKIYGFVKFDFIRNNYLKKISENKNSTIQENFLLFEVKKYLTRYKNIFLMNNNSTCYLFNHTKFSSYELEEFFETNYEQRCEIEDSEIQNIVNKIREEGGDFSLLISEIFHDELEDENDSKENLAEIKENFSSDILQKIILVDDFKSLKIFSKKCESFKEISVDLEGKLSSLTPEIDLIQMTDSNSEEIYIIDVFKIFKCEKIEKSQSEIKFLKIILTYIFESNTILKIFHDGRNDCSSLHNFFKICTSNYIDTSCVYAATKQIQHQIEFHTKFKKELISGEMDAEYYLLFSNINNSINPGLNKVLENFQSDKNVNNLKEKMQQRFSKESSREEYFLRRPIDEEFLIYAALDVKYLHDTYCNMRKELEKLFKGFYALNSSCNSSSSAYDSKIIEIFMRLISNEHMKMSCKNSY